MGLLSGLGRATRATGRGTKIAARAATSSTGSKAIIGGALAAGVYKTAARPAMDATLDVAFNDPDADRKFTGGKLSPLIFGGGVIGGAANAARLASPQYYQDYAHVSPHPAAQVAAIGGGGAIGGTLGAIAGGILGRGVKGAVRGGLIGAIGGSAAMAAPPMMLAAHRAEKNMQSGIGVNKRLNPNTLDLNYDAPQESYLRNSSLRRQEQMNSSGDMVLGMYNLRRGG
jgi:hypothetical protein